MGNLNKQSSETSSIISKILSKIGKGIKWYLIFSFGAAIIAGIILGISGLRSQSASEKVEQAIAEYDFVAAHEYLSKVGYLSKDELTEKVVRAEITFNIANGQINQALQIARESNKEQIYSEIMVSEVNNALLAGKTQESYNLLSSWIFTESFKSSSTDHCSNEEMQNYEYNKQINSFNSLVDNLMIKYIASKDTEMVNNCLLLYKPVAVLCEKTKVDDYRCDFKYELQNLALELAQKKLKSVGWD